MSRSRQKCNDKQPEKKKGRRKTQLKVKSSIRTFGYFMSTVLKYRYINLKSNVSRMPVE